jgi:CO/xanthine dehydrogenase FAD-binding subunit
MHARHGDFAMVSAAAQIALDAEGRCLRAAAAQCEPGDDLHASAAYRRHLAQVLATRVLRAAQQQAERLQ